MLIDCDSCTVRGDSCADCVVTFLTIPVGAPDVLVALGAPGAPGASGGPAVRAPQPPGAVRLNEAERSALGVLADSGLVPPLRLAR